ncbi:hypothetical protein, partial [Fibrobacter sp. UWEL]|uniref:hypothetical protein n=1 Tax=Fibrobacter sp. UWEL TaxID=1896209 RepID=UPI000919ECCF
GSLADTHCLCSDTETSAIHEGHHVLDETELAAAAEFCLSVLVNQFAGGGGGLPLATAPAPPL